MIEGPALASAVSVFSIENPKRELFMPPVSLKRKQDKGMLNKSPLDEVSEDDLLFEEPYEVPKEHFPACNSITFKDIVSDVSVVPAKRFFPSCGINIFRAVDSEGV